MKEQRAVVSDEAFAESERFARELGVSIEELVKRSLADGTAAPWRTHDHESAV